MSRRSGRRRYLAPEIVQTSSMDCGPAALKSLLHGFDINVSYGRLREACQTDLDGTSIDTLEEVAKDAGLDAEQVLVPAEHVLLREAQCLPCLAAARTAGGITHFIIIWRRHGPLVQVMDPARGRLWLSQAAISRQLATHAMAVPAADWLRWATTDDFLAPLRSRLRRIGVSAADAAATTQHASAGEDWRPLAALDASVRMIAALQSEGALARRTAARDVAAMTALAQQSPQTIPAMYWSAMPTTDPSRIQIRGAVLTRIKGTTDRQGSALRERSPELAAAFAEPPVRPLRDLARVIRPSGSSGATVLGAATAAVVLGVVFEALLLRSAVDVRSLVQGPGQLIGAGVALVVFATLLLGLEIIAANTERRLGNHLEARLRIAFLDTLPRLADAYFLSRPIADMLERSHTLHVLRTFPRVAVRFGRVALELLVTALALIWLNPETAWLALSACAAAALIPLAGQSFIAERDLRTRTHAGALSRFHLDALRGRTPLEAHGAQGAIEREHEALLSEWASSAMSLQRASMAIEAVQMVVGFGLAAWMLFSHVEAHATAPLLLQAYWMLNLPGLGYELALIAREYPAYRSTIIRLLEPLRAPHSRLADSLDARSAGSPAVISLRDVAVRTSGHLVLQDVNVTIGAGEHVAIVGPSGAGKSTLVGLLLGWCRPADGELLVDDARLTDEALARLRSSIAWIDPTVQLWNASLLANLLYGTEASVDAVGAVLEPSGLLPVVARLPEGLATRVGEGGALLSAGEAQRVRLARAMLKPTPRLALLDEPFVGLERERRRALLAHARQRWTGTTLLYVTHDLPESRSFDRVLVLDHGRIVEDGDPRQLANSPSSRYRRLLQAHEATQSRFLAGEWRRLRMETGRLVHDHARSNEQSA